MNLKQLLKIFSNNACHKVYVKLLAENDNSKNQVYFGGSFDILNMLPASEILRDEGGNRQRESFKSKLDFYWINEEGNNLKAPHAQLILYPDYPEVRFSGFLLGSKGGPSLLMNSRIQNRVLFLGVSDDRKIYGFVIGPESEIANEFSAIKELEKHGIFSILTILNDSIQTNPKEKLITELKRINQLGWIESKRLTPSYLIVPCESSNCGGFTLEAELNIPSNPKSEPDYLGWEIKNFRVTNFERIISSTITLMDHSPTHGYFNQHGAEAFIRKYGYSDRRGREARFNFGGTHRNDTIHNLTSLKLVIVGFDNQNLKITDTNGFVALIDKGDNIAASWSFASFIEHWNKKHSNACYVPSKIRRLLSSNSKQQYSFGNKIILGSYTDITLLLKEIHDGNVFYDPGFKLELAIENQRNQTTKVRSSFRIKSGNLSALYKKNEIVNLDTA